MQTETHEILPGIISIKDPDRLRYGFRISHSSRPDTHSIKSNQASTPGLIVRDNSISLVDSSGFYQDSGRYISVEIPEFITLYDVLKMNIEEAAVYLLKLTKAVELLAERQFEIPRIQTNAVLFLNNGGIFFLHGVHLNRFRDTLHEKERIHYYEKYNDFRYKGLNAFAFTLGVICYTLLCGKYPVNGETIGEVRHQIARKNIIPVQNIDPRIPAEISGLIQKSLLGIINDFEQWTKILSVIKRDNWRVSPSTETEQVLLSEGKKMASRFERKDSLERFFRHNRYKLAIATVIGIVVFTVLHSVVSRALEPPVTVGLEPVDVVELFYSSRNSFDHHVLPDTITRNAGSRFITEAVHIYAFIRMTESYGAPSPYVNVQNWIDNGRPPLTGNLAVHGLANLEITQIGELEFKAEYERWTTEPANTIDNPDGPDVITGHFYRDYLVLEWRNNAWIISHLEHQIIEPIDTQ